MRAVTFSALTLAVLLSGGCLYLKTSEPIRVHAVVDVNVRVDQAVSNLLADVYGDSATIKTR